MTDSMDFRRRSVFRKSRRDHLLYYSRARRSRWTARAAAAAGSHRSDNVYKCRVYRERARVLYHSVYIYI